jgi:hypothetical protein
MRINYIGVIDGMHTWEVRDETGAVVGMNQCADLTPSQETIDGNI